MLLTVALAIPRVGNEDTLWANGLYDSLVVILLFPLIVFIGASGTIENEKSKRFCSFLGDISYPIYIIHYPIVYIFYGWVNRNNLLLKDAWMMGIIVFVVIMIVAYASLRWYDVPIRKWLATRFLGGNS